MAVKKVLRLDGALQFRFPLPAVAAALAMALADASVAAPSSTPLEAWRRLPVLEDGRVMPLDTFARRRVETITNSQSPKLPESPVQPDGPERRWDASSLLLDWLCRPEAWERVPFLTAEHEEVRTLLGLPVFAEHGGERVRLKYASPDDVAESTRLRERLIEIDDRRRKARADGESFRLEGADAKIDRLWQAFVTYRQLSFREGDDQMGRSRFVRLLEAAVRAWQGLERRLPPSSADATTSVKEAFAALATKVGQSTRFPTPEVLAAIDELRAAVGKLKADAGEASGRMIRQFDERLQVLAESLYDNGDGLLVVPALHAEALEAERNADDDAPPWLALATLLDAPPGVLRGYPADGVARVREAFAGLRSAVAEGGSAEDAARSLASALRSLGAAVEADRRSLPVERPDKDLLAWTAYPAAGSTDREVAYNTRDPFRMSWVLALAALAAFAVAFGKAKAPMFWLGVALLVAEIAWTAGAFAARVAITGWAPVTNMYETVIYVPFFLSLMGLWFVLSPLASPGIARAWKATTHWGFLPARVAVSAGVLWLLAIAPYAAGGRTILNLLPQTDVDSSIPNLNNLVVWLVGLGVLLPAVWYLPRVVLAAVASPFTIPRALRSADTPSLLAQAYARRSFGLVATAVAFAGTFIAWFFPIPGKQFSPLQPVLRDNFWLTIHVLTIVSSYAAGALAWGLGCLSLGHYLFGAYRPLPSGGARAPEACDALAGFIYKTMQVAVLLLAAGTILGGLWADVSWGRFWGWDPKEVWALVSLLAYLVVLHGRYAGWIDNFGLAAGSVIGAAVIGMSWYGVNFLLGAGLHSYGFGQGGQTEFFVFLGLNMLLLVAALLRARSAARPSTPMR